MAHRPKHQRNRERIDVPNGCSFTEPYISPDNWNTAKASVRKKWFIRFTYYDPIHRPNGKAIKWEKTINNFKTLFERQEEGRKVLEQIEKDLKQGLNPVICDTPLRFNPIEIEGKEIIQHEFLTQSSSFKKVIEWSFNQLPANDTKKDIRSYLYYIYPAMTIARLDKFPIRDITSQHILLLLTAASKIENRWDEKRKKLIKLTWSDYKWNRTLDYLSMLLNRITSLAIIAINPCYGISKKTWEVKTKIGLTKGELIGIDERLKQKPDYRRFIQIFHSSGSRFTEMMKVQAKDVHLGQHVFYRWVLKKKSKKIVQVRTTISASVIHLWHEQLAMCTSPDDYLFTKNFQPGKKRIGVRAVNNYWKRLVQDPLGVTQGPYILKHMFLTALKKKYTSETAASHAGHGSTAMVDSVYDLDRDDSEHERIKNANIAFLPQQMPASTAACQRVPFYFSSIN